MYMLFTVFHQWLWNNISEVEIHKEKVSWPKTD